MCQSDVRKSNVQNKIQVAIILLGDGCTATGTESGVFAHCTMDDKLLMLVTAIDSDFYSVFVDENGVYKNVGRLFDEGNKIRFVKNQEYGYLIPDKIVQKMLNNYNVAMEGL